MDPITIIPQSVTISAFSGANFTTENMPQKTLINLVSGAKP